MASGPKRLARVIITRGLTVLGLIIAGTCWMMSVYMLTHLEIVAAAVLYLCGVTLCLAAVVYDTFEEESFEK